MRGFLRAVALLGCALSASTADAKVTRLEIASRQPYGAFKPGDYVRLDGRIAGVLSPDLSGIPDLDKAQRNTDGRVAYSARIVLFVPADPALHFLRDDAIYPEVNRADYAPTIYPPFAQIVFFLVTRLSETLVAMKLAMIGWEAAQAELRQGAAA